MSFSLALCNPEELGKLKPSVQFSLALTFVLSVTVRALLPGRRELKCWPASGQLRKKSAGAEDRMLSSCSNSPLNSKYVMYKDGLPLLFTQLRPKSSLGSQGICETSHLLQHHDKRLSIGEVTSQVGYARRPKFDSILQQGSFSDLVKFIGCCFCNPGNYLQFMGVMDPGPVKVCIFRKAQNVASSCHSNDIEGSWRGQFLAPEVHGKLKVIMGGQSLQEA